MIDGWQHNNNQVHHHHALLVRYDWLTFVNIRVTMNDGGGYGIVEVINRSNQFKLFQLLYTYCYHDQWRHEWLGMHPLSAYHAWLMVNKVQIIRGRKHSRVISFFFHDGIFIIIYPHSARCGSVILSSRDILSSQYDCIRHRVLL